MLAFSGLEDSPVHNSETQQIVASMGAGITEEEGSLVLPDGTSLYTKCWKPAGPTRAILAFHHGYSDHCNSFFDFFPTLASSGFEVQSLDQRGWGRSVVDKRKLRGDFGSTTTVMTDLHFFLQSLVPRTREGAIPLFLMGHSMGGMNVLYYVLNPESPYYRQQKQQQQQQQQQQQASTIKLAGVMAVAPLVAVHPDSQPLKIVEFAGRIARHIVPKMTMVQKIQAQYVSKNQAVVDDITNDKGVLYHNTGTLEGLAGMLDRAAWLNSRKPPAAAAAAAAAKDKAQAQSSLSVPPLWVGHGSDDRITWFDATRRLVDGMHDVADKSFVSYEGAYHKLMNEPNGVAEKMTSDVTAWMEARLAA